MLMTSTNISNYINYINHVNDIVQKKDADFKSNMHQIYRENGDICDVPAMKPGTKRDKEGE